MPNNRNDCLEWFDLRRLMLPLGCLVALVLWGAASPAGAEAQKLTVWLTDWNNNTRRWWYTDFYPAWKKEHPDVAIELTWQGWDNFTDKLTTATAGGEAPDIFQPGAEFVWEMAQNGFAAPLDKQWQAWGKLDDYFPLTLDTVRYGGHLYGVPVLSAPRAFLVHTDLLSDSGFDPSARPHTWDEFKSMAQKLTKSDGQLITQLGIDLEWNFHKYLAFLWQAGGRIVDPASRQVLLDQPAAVEALQYLVDLNKAVVQDRPIKEGLGFRVDSVALQYDSQFGLQRVSATRPDDLKYVAVAEPLSYKAQSTPVFTDWLAVSRDSKQSELAWSFIQFFSRPDNLAKYDQTLYFIPPSKSGVAAAAFMRATPALLDFADVMVKFGRPVPSYPAPGHLDDVLNQAISNAIKGELTPQAALTAATVQFRNAIGK